MPDAHIAAVYAKPMGKPLVDTFITEVSQDTWIFFPWDTALSFQPPIREGGPHGPTHRVVQPVGPLVPRARPSGSVVIRRRTFDGRLGRRAIARQRRRRGRARRRAVEAQS